MSKPLLTISNPSPRALACAGSLLLLLTWGCTSPEGSPDDDETTEVQDLVDTDGDGLSDAREAELGTDPERADTDGDGRDDLVEVEEGTDPLVDEREDTSSCTEGATSSCGSEVGACEPGSRVCEDGEWGACEGQVEPAEEVCDGGLDEDCDGEVDEGCECVNGDQIACGEDEGACEQGLRVCVDGAWGACERAVGPTDEVCDGAVDEDCDGTVDEGCECVNGDQIACGEDEGACEQGSSVCVDGEWGECEGQVEPADEVCDGARDEDCDGEVDEGCECVEGDTDACGSDVGQCTLGSRTCRGGRWSACDAVSPTEEVCDGVDNDCNGVEDDGCDCVTGDTEPCGVDEGLCEAGVRVCDESGRWGVCEGAIGPAGEVCDGVQDENCDGEVDEGCECVNGDQIACGEDEGACEQGSSVCVDGAWGACEGAVGPAEEVCEGWVDEDCDGEIDEGFGGTCGGGCSFDQLVAPAPFDVRPVGLLPTRITDRGLTIVRVFEDGELAETRVTSTNDDHGAVTVDDDVANDRLVVTAERAFAPDVYTYTSHGQFLSWRNIRPGTGDNGAPNEDFETATYDSEGRIATWDVSVRTGGSSQRPNQTTSVSVSFDARGLITRFLYDADADSGVTLERIFTYGADGALLEILQYGSFDGGDVCDAQWTFSNDPETGNLTMYEGSFNLVQTGCPMYPPLQVDVPVSVVYVVGETCDDYTRELDTDQDGSPDVFSDDPVAPWAQSLTQDTRTLDEEGRLTHVEVGLIELFGFPSWAPNRVALDFDSYGNLTERVEYDQVEWCLEGETATCEGSDVGACEPGTRVCAASGRWGACEGVVEPADEVCDGAVDEDCDGFVDEIFDENCDPITCDVDRFAAPTPFDPRPSALPVRIEDRGLVITRTFDGDTLVSTEVESSAPGHTSVSVEDDVENDRLVVTVERGIPGYPGVYTYTSHGQFSSYIEINPDFGVELETRETANYDSEGRITSWRRSVEEPSGDSERPIYSTTLNATFDPRGLIKRFSYARQQFNSVLATRTFSYDSEGRVSGIYQREEDGGGACSTNWGFDYDPDTGLLASYEGVPWYEGGGCPGDPSLYEGDVTVGYDFGSSCEMFTRELDTDGDGAPDLFSSDPESPWSELFDMDNRTLDEEGRLARIQASSGTFFDVPIFHSPNGVSLSFDRYGNITDAVAYAP